MNRKSIARKYEAKSYKAFANYTASNSTGNDYLSECAKNAQEKALLFPVGQKVRKKEGGWKWKGAIATVIGHKQKQGEVKLFLKFEDTELEEIYNQPFPWGLQDWEMSDFEPIG